MADIVRDCLDVAESLAYKNEAMQESLTIYSTIINGLFICFILILIYAVIITFIHFRGKARDKKDFKKDQ